MEANKISKNAKSITLENGLELTYCEFGESNEEVMISGAFYFHTFTPVLEELGGKYHVYGVVMRMDDKGPINKRNDDGSINWSRQWGEDIYRFAKEKGIEKFHYIGKCHGTNPGWYLIKEHPEMLDTFASFYMAPHVCPRNSEQWIEFPKQEGQAAFLSRSIRHQERIPIKIAEVQTLGAGGGPEAGSQQLEAGKYADAPQLIWDTLEECEETLKNIKTPILFVFGTEDILFHDYFDSNLKAMQIIPRAKTVLLQGERHLMEMDCPERMASEALFFIDESRKNY
jgi:pimeloyl-ACP methyl ester carboxylesterase